MNPNPAMNPGAHPHVVVVQQSPIPMQYIPQPMYGQQFPSSIPPGGFSSAPGLIVCPRCGVRGLTRTTPVSGSTTHFYERFVAPTTTIGCHGPAPRRLVNDPKTLLRLIEYLEAPQHHLKMKNHGDP
ncbi:hypothetical protein M408DRAFT_25635 [Serendipita vermifera MAFF 305830]|uniref:LITAF domain-containing protein n=1 Tax=Serendipita vermifera MAFF 305830 TaxID=933852 RepID=A0A0C2WIM2_SERVB|nr:hypothetical protein M408DRAFT_25635 [Serendipita vermifera MAFF 305830]